MVILIMAWRNIWRNKIRSMIIMSSVGVGLAAGLFVLSLYKGILDDRVRNVIDREVSHIQVHHPDFKEDYDARFTIADPEKMVRNLLAIPAINTFALRTVSPGMLMTGSGSTSLQIVGVDPENEDRVSQLSDKIDEGNAFTTEKKNQIVIGRKLAEKMRLRIGSKIVLTFIDPESNMISAAFRVVAIYKTDNAPLDEKVAYVRRSDLNTLLSIGNAFHEVAILLNHDEQVPDVIAAIGQKNGGNLIEAWSDISAETKLMIDTTDSYSNIFIMIIMLALSFGIVNTMLMAVLERSKEIGMLLAIGMNRLKVFMMILTETLFLTISSTPPGILLTWILVRIYQSRGINISSIGGETMSEFGFSSMIYPAFPWDKMPGEMIIVISAALLSSLIPAFKAIRLRPVEALQK